MSKFEFIDKGTCVCGEFLEPNNPVVINHSWGKIEFIKCNSCLTWNQSPEITIDSIMAWYDSDNYQKGGKEGGYLNYESEERHRKVESLLRYRRLISENKIKIGSVLEIGCASGSFLKVLEENGWSVTGIDVSKRFCQLAKKNNIKVICGDFNKYNFENKFDLIAILGSISNLQGVKHSISKAYQLLNKDGCIYINYPDSISFFDFKIIWKVSLDVYAFCEYIFFFKRNQDFSKKEGFMNIRIHRIGKDHHFQN